MLNDQDINKLKSVFATKEDFAGLATKKDLEKTADELRKEIKSSISESQEVLRKEIKSSISDSQDKMLSLLASKQEVKELKSDIEVIRELIQGLIVSSDSIAKLIGELKLEYAAISTQLSRHDKWIKQIAEKVGLTLAAE